MSIIIPISLTVIAFIAILVAYSGIRQGGARVYSLEREALLRRASAAMFIGAGLFLLAIALLIFQGQQVQALIDDSGVEDGNVAANDATQLDSLVATPAAEGVTVDNGGNGGVVPTNQIPGLSTVTLTPTLDPNLPTATPTPIIIRGFVTGTGGNGLYLRETPGGAEITILGEDEFVTVRYEEGVTEVGGIRWVKVRTFLGDEGWVAEDFLEIEEQN
ncbi:MAG: SH3 domain-containing protein [Chloroflexota bacterium]